MLFHFMQSKGRPTCNILQGIHSQHSEIDSFRRGNFCPETQTPTCLIPHCHLIIPVSTDPIQILTTRKKTCVRITDFFEEGDALDLSLTRLMGKAWGQHSEGPNFTMDLQTWPQLPASLSLFETRPWVWVTEGIPESGIKRWLLCSDITDASVMDTQPEERVELDSWVRLLSHSQW